MENNKKPINWIDTRLDLRKEYELPPVILKIDNSIVATLGNFSASAGKEKSKKTFNVSALTASLISGKQTLNYKPIIPSHKTKILYADTEQSDYHCRKVATRIQKLTNSSIEELEDKLIFLTLRKYTSEQRIEIIENAIYDNPEVFFVVIDGLRDLVLDINNPTEATKIMTKLLTWTDDRNIHIHCVLHLNKGDENTRGHLGTELNNKSESILQITKDPHDKDRSTVSAKTVRDIAFDDFAFFINEDGLPEIVDDYSPTDSKPFSYSELSEEMHRKALAEVFNNKESLGYSELISKLKDAYLEVAGLQMGVGKTKKLKVFLQNKRMITQAEKNYLINKDYKY
ncbi:AAA family ATPase [Winogradskyella sp. PAMC22761]|nr:AAA family ATPase [Winogradskyella sp. PAMC22761]